MLTNKLLLPAYQYYFLPCFI